jgi:uncharacterized lipoprotein YmbA
VTRVLIGLAAVSLMSVVLMSCASSLSMHFYTLDAAAIESSGREKEKAAVYSVSVGPVTVPETVDRPQLVVRIGANQVSLVEDHRWAQPLKSEIPRVIAEQLAHLLGAQRVVTFSQNTVHDAEYRVLVDIQRFDSTVGQNVVIEAMWVVRRVAEGQSKTGRSVVQEFTSGEGYDAVVEAHSRALATISRDIAEAVRLSNSFVR